MVSHGESVSIWWRHHIHVFRETPTYVAVVSKSETQHSSWTSDLVPYEFRCLVTIIQHETYDLIAKRSIRNTKSYTVR